VHLDEVDVLQVHSRALEGLGHGQGRDP
jgi:hypothetical protein